MRWVYLLTAVILLHAPSAIVAGEWASIPGAFQTANSWLRLGLVEQLVYVTGIIDGFTFASALEGDRSSLNWVPSCVTNMEAGQLRLMVRKEVGAKPAEWHTPMQLFVYRALLHGCPNGPKE